MLLTDFFFVHYSQLGSGSVVIGPDPNHWTYFGRKEIKYCMTNSTAKHYNKNALCTLVVNSSKGPPDPNI